MSPRKDTAEQGAIAILVAICLTIFVALLAITVDIAHVRAQRADAQAAADNAALAAAWRSCKNLTTGENAARGVASANGFSTGVSVVEESQGVWRVTIDTGVFGTFANVLGVATLETSVTAKAGASCAPGGPGSPVVHASGTCSDADKGFKVSGEGTRYTGDIESGHDVQWSGNQTTVHGKLHANTVLKINGNNDAVTDADSPDTVEVESGGGHVTYVDSLDNSGSGNTWVSMTQVAPQAMSQPLTWSKSQFQPGGNIYQAASAAGELFTTIPGGTTIPSGLYVVSSDKIELENREAGPDGVTIVTTHSKGQIIVKGGTRLHPYKHAESMLFGTWADNGAGDCDYFGIEMPGDDNELSGVFYAPESLIKVNGSQNKVTGSSISRAVELGGNYNVWIASIGGSLPTQLVDLRE